MEELLRVKTAQHPDIVEILKESGERTLLKNYDTDSGVPDDRHVLGTMSFSDACQIFLEGDVEDPVQGIFDLPMCAYGPGGLFGGQGARGNVVATIMCAVCLMLDAGLDLDDGSDLGKAMFSGEAASSGYPINGVGDLVAALLNVPVVFIVLDITVDQAFGWCVKEVLDLAMECGLVLLDRQKVAGLAKADSMMRAPDRKMRSEGITARANQQQIKKINY